jgi:hypothetical protein
MPGHEADRKQGSDHSNSKTRIIAIAKLFGAPHVPSRTSDFSLRAAETRWFVGALAVCCRCQGERRQIGPLHPLHGEVEHPVRLTGVVDGDDVGVLQGGRQARLPDESCGSQRSRCIHRRPEGALSIR